MWKICLFLGKLDTGQKKIIFSNAEEEENPMALYTMYKNAHFGRSLVA